MLAAREARLGDMHAEADRDGLADALARATESSLPCLWSARRLG